MRRKTTDQFSQQQFRSPAAWRKPTVLLSSLGINILALAMPTVILQVYDRIIPNQALETFTFIILGMVSVVVLDTLLKVFRSRLLSWEGARFDHRESLKAMNCILDADSQEFGKNSSGFYLDKMHALEQIQEFYSGQSVLLMMDFPFVVIFLVLIWVIAGPLTWIPVALLLLFAIVSMISGRKLHDALKTRSTMEDRRQDFIIETLRGIHSVKSMAMESFMLRRYEKLQHQSAASVFQLSQINSIVQGIGATFSQVSVVSFAAIGSLWVISGNLTVGGLAAGTMLSGRVLQPGLKAMGLWTQFQSLRLARRKVEELYKLKTEQGGKYKNPGKPLVGPIQLEHVQFGYSESQQLLLEDVSLTIQPGEAIGITGSNGSGKTTLVGLLSGLLSPTEGRILLGGDDLTKYDLEYLRSNIGIVPQKGVLFEGSILDNMTLYREGAAIDDAIELARSLGLDKIISRMPQGLDTYVGGAAVDTLSEGVRQKITMVRSLVGHPSIILFDDANANFDIKNDEKLLSVMKRMKGERTLVVVSHRPSFLRICDRRFTISERQLIEEPAVNSKPDVHINAAKLA
ncbi:MAG: ATP-binding cassette domain-containing protein [Gammaproteobacteria bacterium]|nr:ATP-binding cassette domain-containing protein [Gammaproteobacteria bacterium]